LGRDLSRFDLDSGSYLLAYQATCPREGTLSRPLSRAVTTLAVAMTTPNISRDREIYRRMSGGSFSCRHGPCAENLRADHLNPRAIALDLGTPHARPRDVFAVSKTESSR
jgi:hypothetical protein